MFLFPEKQQEEEDLLARYHAEVQLLMISRSSWRSGWSSRRCKLDAKRLRDEELDDGVAIGAGDPASSGIGLNLGESDLGMRPSSRARSRAPSRDDTPSLR